MSGSAGGGTVVDALVVTLGLDPSKFTQGQKDALGGIEGLIAGTAKVDDAGKKAAGSQQQRDRQRKSEQDKAAKAEAKQRTDEQKAIDKARADEARKDAEAARQKAKVEQQAAKERKEAWLGAKEAALGFGAALAGIASADFFKNTAQGVADTGRLAHNLGMSTAEVTAWGNAVASAVGGNAQAATGSLQNLSNAMTGLRTGQDMRTLPTLLGQLSRYSGEELTLKGPDGKFLDPEHLMLELSKAGPKTDPRIFSSLLSGIMDQGSINLLEKGPRAVQGAIDAAKGRGVPDDKTAENMSKLQTAVVNLEQAFLFLGQRLVFKFGPDITRFLEDVSSLLKYLGGVGSPDGMTFQQLQGERAQHRHEANVAILQAQGLSAPEAEARVKAAEVAGTDPTVSTKPSTGPGLVKRIERFLGMPAGLTPSPALPKEIEDEVRKDAIARGADPDHMVALFRAEGGGYNKVSAAGAFGPAQLMPGTAAFENVATSPDAPNYDWRENVAAGVRYWVGLMSRFHGNVQGADAAYNAGPGGRGVADFVGTGDRSGLPAETNHYVDQIAANMAPGPPASSVTNGGDTNTVTIGTVTVQTQATDTASIVRDMNKTLRAHPLIAMANSGQE